MEISSFAPKANLPPKIRADLSGQAKETAYLSHTHTQGRADAHTHTRARAFNSSLHPSDPRMEGRKMKE